MTGPAPKPLATFERIIRSERLRATPPQKAALSLALVSCGNSVAAGATIHRGGTIRVAASTLSALERRGLMVRMDILDPDTGSYRWYELTVLGRCVAVAF